MSQRQSFVSANVRKQSDAATPEMKMVKVAVIPPRLPRGMAPPTGVGGEAGCFGWDEAINWQHNDPVEEKQDKGKKHSFRRKVGLTSEKTKRSADLPVFFLRDIPYDTWRKHYAKDADGNYRGTHAPAQDCILKPEDVAKWRLEEPVTKADKFTRGAAVLPVYEEIHNDPASGIDDTWDDATPPNVPPEQRQPFDIEPDATRKIIADGKTAQEIIEEAKNKPKPTSKKTFKNMLSSGARVAMMGN